ncbi:MAG TPA: formate/nitrite transporter family protein [Candidatus Faecousia excrementigallinarum]|uniref:Formate/nitrite transporter family protein n=1 Tax=Candidatus Faecousia excrementigallinarum TaxID=2840806 RepID=A0A9D0Z2R9_9FIRM|nr:formate/nitrite transporter family protein [Candidatus Faecousia excrementigallinarum]
MNLFTAAETANNYVTAGVGKTKYSIPKMLILGILAGLLIGFPSCVTEMATFSVTNTSMVRMISGLLFAFGLGTVILTGAELFTGNTLITMSLLEKKVTLPSMLKNWLFVYIGNFLGSMLLSAICAYFGWLSAGSNALAVSAMKMAVGKMTMPFQNAFFMGVLCNILVTIGVLMSLSGKDGTSRFLGAWVPVMFFVTCGFNHSIADMTYCMLGLFAKNVTAYASAAAEAGIALDSLTWGNYFVGNLIPVTLGNLLGGVAVGVTMWYAYVRKAAGKK